MKTGILLQGLDCVPDTRAGTGSLPPNRMVASVLQHPRRDGVTLGLVNFVLRSQRHGKGEDTGCWGSKQILREGKQDKREALCCLV